MLWFKENLSTIIICAVLILIVAAVVYSMVKNKKKGVSSCGCSCTSCPMANKCHSTSDK